MTKTNRGFLVSMKIGDKVVPLQIDPQDSKESLYQKLLRVHPNCIFPEQLAVNKIIRQLVLSLTSDEISGSLKQAIRQCLERLVSAQQTSQDGCQLSSMSASNACKSVIIKDEEHTSKLFKHKEIQTQQKKMSESNVLQDISINIPFRKAVNSRNVPVSQKKLFIRKRSENLHLSVLKGERSSVKSRQKRKKNYNPDIIKACEIVYKKCHQKDMKAMAKDLLKQNGCLKQEKEVLIEERRMKMLVTQTSEKPISQKSKHQSSFILSDKSLVSNPTEQSVCEKAYERPSRSQHSFNRFKYLDCSIDNLKNEYAKKEGTFQTGTVRPPKKYSYLD